MTNAQKHAKLANAIREYRGAWDPYADKWIRAPQPKVRERVEQWLQASCLPVEESLSKIDGFKSIVELNEWLGGL